MKKHLLLKGYCTVAAFIATHPALAGPRGFSDGRQGKISEWQSEVAEEAFKWLDFAYIVAAIVGALFFIIALISTIIAKNRKEPMTWQLYGLIGGAALCMAGLLLGLTVGSLGGGDVDAFDSMRL